MTSLTTAVELVTRTRHGSPSMLMRRLNQDHGIRLSFSEANALLDRMETLGIVGPQHGSRARDVLMHPDAALYVATPCSAAACEPGGEPCTTHERLMAHAEGDHELCSHADGTPAGGDQ